VAADSIPKANAAYDRWLRREIRGKVVAADLRKKREKMASGPFPFLRATYWRWAETILDICPDLADAPTTLAVGDIHLENFGVWLDDDGRLIWGVNDFDEAASCPTRSTWCGSQPAQRCAAIAGVPGRRNLCRHPGWLQPGTENPPAVRPRREHVGLHKLLIASEDEHARFWDKIAKLKARRICPALSPRDRSRVAGRRRDREVLAAPAGTEAWDGHAGSASPTGAAAGAARGQGLGAVRMDARPGRSATSCAFRTSPTAAIAHRTRGFSATTRWWSAGFRRTTARSRFEAADALLSRRCSGHGP
jgi:hypothetical protein